MRCERLTARIAATRPQTWPIEWILEKTEIEHRLDRWIRGLNPQLAIRLGQTEDPLKRDAD